MNFTEFPLQEQIQKAVEAMGFIEPTPVQEQVIPFLLEKSRRDLVGLSQTGTGKTAAFGLPLLHTLDFTVRTTQVLVLCPTRELCQQIERDMRQFSRFMPDPGIIAVYGGAGYRPQIDALRRGARIIIATPGRLRDLMGRGVADLSSLTHLILDEADTMLNMGFKEELDEILTSVPPERTTLLFSATMPPEVAAIAATYMRNPVEITMGRKNAGAATIEHRYCMVHARDKFLALKRLADYYPEIYGIIFCRTRIEARSLAEKLVKEGYNADALHGDLSQQQREAIMQKFRDGPLSLLVATDIAARGLDVQNLTHVIHYDLPDELETYNHRSGRTGRAGKSGLSLAIINMKERHKIRRIEQLISQKITETPVPGGREICEQQLLHLVDRIRSSQVDEQLIGPYLPLIEEKLSGLDREKIIGKVLSLEFNRFLTYYEQTPDLSPVKPENSFQRTQNDRFERPQAYRRPFPETGGENTVWLTINLGTNDRFFKKELLSIINRQTDGRQIPVGKIVTSDTYTRFEVPSDAGEAVEQALSRISVMGKRVRIKQRTPPYGPGAGRQRGSKYAPAYRGKPAVHKTRKKKGD